MIQNEIKQKFLIEEFCAGIYYVSRSDSIAIQIVVSKELDDKYYADSVWEIVTTQNKKLFEEMREDEDMCKAMAELFKPEIDAAFDNGVDNKGIQVFKNMIERGFSREEAQQLADISDELVKRALAEG